jgi:hypothetical protein
MKINSRLTTTFQTNSNPNLFKIIPFKEPFGRKLSYEVAINNLNSTNGIM